MLNKEQLLPVSRKAGADFIQLIHMIVVYANKKVMKRKGKDNLQ